MNPSYIKVLRYLTGRENIDDVSVDEFQTLADENPYFSVSRFLLTKKLKAENSTGFEPQLQKNVLYFSNPFWLQYQLSDGVLPDVFISGDNYSVELAERQKEEVFEDGNGRLEEVETQNELKPAEELLPKVSGEERIPADEEEKQSIAATNSSSDAYGMSAESEHTSQPDEEAATLVPEPDANTEVFLDQLDTVVLENISNYDEEILHQNKEFAGDQTVTATLEEMAGVTNDTNEVTQAFLDEAQTAQINPEKSTINPESFAPEYEETAQQISEPDEHEKMYQNIKAMLDASSEEADADLEDTVIPIDPYYTIDYFASQGIKLELEPNPKDQLGQNLKKFTHWLKHMKKLGPEDATEVITRTHSDSDIQQIAESSNTVREVVTEAMAMVLEKQGKNGKAIELYKKLSFLIPDKNAYFAAKIKNLKGI